MFFKIVMVVVFGMCVATSYAERILDGSVGILGIDDGAGLSNVVEDTSPQLGGNLDGQGFEITDIVIDSDTNTVHADTSYISVRNVSGSTITAGSPVYNSGYNAGQDKVEVELADANDPAKMPAIGLMESDVLNNANAHVIWGGRVVAIDTTGSPVSETWAVGEDIYVSATVGELTNVKPTGSTEEIQKVAEVTRAHATLGRLLVQGAGRTNDVPNNITVAAGWTDSDPHLTVTDVTDDVSIGTSTASARLDVQGSAIFNDDGADVDFRIEGDADPNLFYVDAGNDGIGVGTSTANVKLDVWAVSGTDAAIRARSGDHTQPNDYIEGTHNQTDAILTWGNGDLKIQNSSSLGHVILPLENDGVTPTLAFGDGDSGIYQAENNSINFAVSGVGQWAITPTKMGKSQANGPIMLNETPLKTNPVFVINFNDEDTGVGGSVDIVSLIAGGVEGLSVTEAASAITIDATHEIDIRGAVATPGIATLSTAELTVVDGDVLGQIDFQAPLESSGTDANLVAGSIWVEADETFDTGTNTASLVFATATSETATEKMRLDSSGNLGIGVTPGSTNQLHLLMDATKDILIDGTTNPRTVDTGVMRFEHTPSINNTRCVTKNIDVNSMASTHADVANITATALINGETATGYQVNANTANSTGGIIRGFSVSKSGAGSAAVHGFHVDTGCEVISHFSGSFVNVAQGWDENGGFTDTTAAFNSSGTDVTIFDADDDAIYIGLTTTFDQIEVNLDTVAGGAGINPIFEYSSGGGTPVWTVFPVTDETIGFRQNGIISWMVADLVTPTWAVATVNADAGTRFYIRITRTQNTIPVAPIEDTIQVQLTTPYEWDETGNVTINTLILEGSSADGFEQTITTADPTADHTFTLPDDELTNNDLMVGSGVGTFIYTAKSAINLSDFNDDLTHTGGTFTWVNKTGAYTAVAGDGVFVGTVTGAITITLPATPSLGDEVAIIDQEGNATTNNITVGRNSSNIMGLAEDLTMNQDNDFVTLVYSGDATDGWRIR